MNILILCQNLNLPTELSILILNKNLAFQKNWASWSSIRTWPSNQPEYPDPQPESDLTTKLNIILNQNLTIQPTWTSWSHTITWLFKKPVSWSSTRTWPSDQPNHHDPQLEPDLLTNLSILNLTFTPNWASSSSTRTWPSDQPENSSSSTRTWPSDQSEHLHPQPGPDLQTNLSILILN